MVIIFYVTQNFHAKALGRGVGLDAVRAELMEVGIKVMMNTEMGKGSSFIFEIPLDYVCFLEEGQTLLTC